MSEGLATCSHNQQFNTIEDVKVTLCCKNCGGYYDVWLKGLNLQIVKNELEYAEL